MTASMVLGVWQGHWSDKSTRKESASFGVAAGVDWTVVWVKGAGACGGELSVSHCAQHCS